MFGRSWVTGGDRLEIYIVRRCRGVQLSSIHARWEEAKRRQRNLNKYDGEANLVPRVSPWERMPIILLAERDVCMDYKAALEAGSVI